MIKKMPLALGKSNNANFLADFVQAIAFIGLKRVQSHSSFDWLPKWGPQRGFQWLLFVVPPYFYRGSIINAVTDVYRIFSFHQWHQRAAVNAYSYSSRYGITQYTGLNNSYLIELFAFTVVKYTQQMLSVL